MKYKELERVALKSLYTIRKIGVNTVIERESLICNQINRIIIDETKEDTIDIDVLAFHSNDLEILTSAIAYAETPLDERQEEKKYYLKHRFLEHHNYSYLNYDQKLQKLYLNDKVRIDYVQTQFTQKEIDEIKEKYDTTLDDFKIIEVEE